MICTYANWFADIRDNLRAVNEPVSAQLSLFRIVIPSTSSLHEFWLESKQLIAVPHYLQRPLSSPVLAIYVGFNILVALSGPARSEPQNALFKQQSTWILDTFDDLWRCFQRWTISSSIHPLQEETTALYMQLIESYAIAQTEQRNQYAHLRKAVSLSINSVACLVESLIASSMSESNQIQLALLLTRLCHLAQPDVSDTRGLNWQRGSNKVVDTEALRDTIKSVCEKTEVMSGLHEDLQV